MASQLAIKEAGARVKEGFKKLDEMSPEVIRVRIEQAKIIKDNLSQLKGAAQKAGQLLSINATDFLPPEAMAILSELQAGATAMPEKKVEVILLKELGAEKRKTLIGFSEKPVASASIGQVHSAVIGEHKVAIKVQYPGIADSIDSDLTLLRKVSEALAKVSGKDMDLQVLFDEMSEVLHQEADYLLEKNHLEEFGQLLAPYEDYIVPSVFSDYSTRHVLTMSWEEGLPLGKWLLKKPSREKKEKVAELILELYCKEFFEWGFVQTDPNFANFLVRESGSKIQIVCLDFGAAIKYDQKFRTHYVELLKLIEDAETPAQKQRLIEFSKEHGFVDPLESEKTFELFVEMLKVSMEPFRPEHQPFEFSNKNYMERSRKSIQDFSFNVKYSLPQRKLLFLHRKLGGIFQLLKQMEITKDLRPVWQRMVHDAP